jgi:hypothetical protein
LCGIQNTYTNINNPLQTLTSPLIKGNASNAIPTTLNFSIDEQIAQIRGNLSIGIIGRIRILTSHGRYIECGNKNGEEFNWKFNSKLYLIGFRCCTNDYMISLFAIYTDRIPQTQLKNIKKIVYPNMLKPCTVKINVAIISKKEYGVAKCLGVSFDDFFDNDLQDYIDSIKIAQMHCMSITNI